MKKKILVPILRYYNAYLGIPSYTKELSPNTSSYIERLKSYEDALNHKADINHSRREKTNSSRPTEYDFSLDVLIATNLNLSTKDIYCILTLKPTLSECTDSEDFLDYYNLSISNDLRMKIQRIRKRITDVVLKEGVLTTNSEDCLITYIKSLNLCTFDERALTLLARAVSYLREPRRFYLAGGSFKEISFLDAVNDHLVVTTYQKPVPNPKYPNESNLSFINVIRYQKKFIAHFCYSWTEYTRNYIERILVTFNDRKCFSIDDVTSIAKHTKKMFYPPFTNKIFFSDLEFINNHR